MTVIRRRNELKRQHIEAARPGVLSASQPRLAPSCVVGIDQSYSGFAVVVLYEDLSERHTCKNFAPGTYGQGVDRLNAIGAWLAGVLAVFEGIQHVGMEGYSADSKFGRELAGELGFAVKQELRRSLGSPVGYPTIIAPSAVKKFATGKGNVKKDLMLKAVYTKWGFDTNNDNLADAYCVARIAHMLAYGGEPLKYESEVLRNLRRHTECRES